MNRARLLTTLTTLILMSGCVRAEPRCCPADGSIEKVRDLSPDCPAASQLRLTDGWWQESSARPEARGELHEAAAALTLGGRAAKRGHAVLVRGGIKSVPALVEQARHDFHLESTDEIARLVVLAVIHEVLRELDPWEARCFPDVAVLSIRSDRRAAEEFLSRWSWRRAQLLAGR